MHNGKNPTIFGNRFVINCKLPTEIETIKTQLEIEEKNGMHTFPIERTVGYFLRQTHDTMDELGKLLNGKLQSIVKIPCNTAIEGDTITALKPFLT